MKGRTYRYLAEKPLYPFGYGLTYGEATIEELLCNGRKIEAESEVRVDDGGLPDIAVTVKNRSDIEICEVVQIYIKAQSPDAVPNGKLCGIARVRLKAGEQVTVAIPMDEDALTVINEEGTKIVNATRFAVSVGFGQPDERTQELTDKACMRFYGIVD